MVHRGLALALPIISLMANLCSACYHWHPEPLAPSAGADEARASAVKLSLVDGSTLVLYDALVRADSVTGLRSLEHSARIAIPRADIGTMEVRHLHAGKTTLAVGLAVGVVAGVVIFFVALEQSLQWGLAP